MVVIPFVVAAAVLALFVGGLIQAEKHYEAEIERIRHGR